MKCDLFRFTVIDRYAFEEYLGFLQARFGRNEDLHIGIHSCLTGKDISFGYFFLGQKANGMLIRSCLAVGHLDPAPSADPLAPAKIVDVCLRL